MSITLTTQQIQDLRIAHDVASANGQDFGFSVEVGALLGAPGQASMRRMGLSLLRKLKHDGFVTIEESPELNGRPMKDDQFEWTPEGLEALESLNASVPSVTEEEPEAVQGDEHALKLDSIRKLLEMARREMFDSTFATEAEMRAARKMVADAQTIIENYLG